MRIEIDKPRRPVGGRVGRRVTDRGDAAPPLPRGGPVGRPVRGMLEHLVDGDPQLPVLHLEKSDPHVVGRHLVLHVARHVSRSWYTRHGTLLSRLHGTYTQEVRSETNVSRLWFIHPLYTSNAHAETLHVSAIYSIERRNHVD